MRIGLKLLLGISLISSTWSQQDLSFVYRRQGSDFSLLIRQKLPPQVSWSDALNVHGNPELIGQISNYFVESHLRDSLRLNQDFRLLLVAQEMGFRKNVLNQCRESSAENEWQRQCEISTTEENGGEYFRWGRPSTHCHMENAQVICDIRFEGSPKGFNYIIIRRSDAEFGVLLAGVTLDDTAKLGDMILSQNPAQTVRRSYESSDFKKRVQRFRDLAFRQIHQHPDQSFQVTGKSDGSQKLIPLAR